MTWNAKAITLADEDHFQTLNGLWTGKKAPFVKAGVIRNTNFTESGRIDYTDVAWLQVEQKQLAKRQLKFGDIIVERSGGGPKQPVGRVVFFTRDDSPFSFSNFTSAIRVHDTKAFDAKFVFYGLLELYQSGQTEDIQRRTTGIRNLDFTAYKERAAFPRIPLEEQLKIAGVLGLVQRAIDQQERLIALTTELKKALLHQLFTQGLRGEPQKQTEIGPVPESWEVVPLEGVAKIERGKFTHRPRNEPRFYGGQTPFVQTGDVSLCDGRIREYSQTLNEEGVLISKVFPAGTILITIAANIGFSGILEFDSACPDSLIGLTPNERIDVEFLQHYLTTQQPVMDRLAPRGTQKNINIQFLKPWLVPLPSSDEQSEIREALNAVDSKVRVARRKHAALTALFRTLLHLLMTAQLRVQDLDFPEAA